MQVIAAITTYVIVIMQLQLGLPTEPINASTIAMKTNSCSSGWLLPELPVNSVSVKKMSTIGMLKLDKFWEPFLHKKNRKIAISRQRTTRLFRFSLVTLSSHYFHRYIIIIGAQNFLSVKAESDWFKSCRPCCCTVDTSTGDYWQLICEYSSDRHKVEGEGSHWTWRPQKSCEPLLQAENF